MARFARGLGRQCWRASPCGLRIIGASAAPSSRQKPPEPPPQWLASLARVEARVCRSACRHQGRRDLDRYDDQVELLGFPDHRDGHMAPEGPFGEEPVKVVYGGDLLPADPDYQVSHPDTRVGGRALGITEMTSTAYSFERLKSLTSRFSRGRRAAPMPR